MPLTTEAPPLLHHYSYLHREESIEQLVRPPPPGSGSDPALAAGVNKPAETGLMDTRVAGGRDQQSIHLIAILHHRINASTTHTHIYTIYFHFHTQIEKK